MDIFSNSQQVHVDFVCDRKALLTVSAPNDFTVARPSLAVNVSCTKVGSGADEDSPANPHMKLTCLADHAFLGNPPRNSHPIYT